MLTVELQSEGKHRASVRRLGELDWDFPAQFSESAYSTLHWHPCRFPSQIPAITIGRLTQPGDIVLDPFMGSATTLVEAQRLGRRSVGVDINPISCMIAEAKTLTLSGDDVRRYVDGLKLALAKDWHSLKCGVVAQSVQVQKWYMPNTLVDLCKLWGLVQDYNSHAKPIGLSAFSSILLGACRETRHWGYVCDNTTPQSERATDVRGLFLSALQKFAAAYHERDNELHDDVREATVRQGDACTILQQYPENYFSCVVTSPPYFGVADYVKAQRLSMEWFGFEIEPFRQQEIGARSKRHRKDAESSYIQDTRIVFTEVFRTLKRGGYAIIVVGQSPKRNDILEIYVNVLCEIGFTLELERRRQIPTSRRQMPSLADEVVLVLRK